MGPEGRCVQNALGWGAEAWLASGGKIGKKADVCVSSEVDIKSVEPLHWFGGIM